MNFLRKHKTTFAMAIAFGITWMVASVFMSKISDEGSLHWSLGILAAAVWILFGVFIGSPEERSRGRELRRGAKCEMWGRG